MSRNARPRPTRSSVRWGHWRVALRRSRIPRIIVVVGFGLLAGQTIDAATTRAEAQRARWADTVEVRVMQRDLPAGALIGPEDTAVRLLPVAVVPRDPVLDDPTGSRLRDPVATDEVLREGRLSSRAGSASAARLPPGTAGLGIDDGGADFTIGDRIDLHGLLTGIRLARDAEVIALADGGITVAIGSAEIDAVIRALTTGGVVPVLVG